MSAATRATSGFIAIAIGAGLAAGWLAIHLPSALSLRLAGDPVQSLVLLAALLVLGPLVFLALLRRPGLALVVLVVAVWTNLSEVLVRFHGLPSLLQLVTIPILMAVLWTSADSAVRLLRSPLFLAASGWLLWNGISVFWALRPEMAINRTLEAAKAWLVFVLVALLSASIVRLRRASWAIVLSAGVLASLGVWQVLTGGFDQQFGGLARIKDAQIYGDVFEARIAGPLGDPNFFAQILLMAVPVALALGWSAGPRPDRRPGVRLVSLLLAGVLLAALLLTYSRGAAVALALVLTAALLVRGVRLRHLVAVGVLLLSVALIAPFGLVQRLETLGQVLPGVHASESIHPDSSFAKRRLVTSTAWEVFSEHPVVGVGAGNYGEAFLASSRRVGTDAVLYEDPGVRNYPHNLYLEIAAETGGVGVVLFGLMIVAAIATLRLTRSRATGRRQRALGTLADGFILSLAGFLLTALFLHWEFPRYFELLLGLIAGLGLAASRPVGHGGGWEIEEGDSAVEDPDATAGSEAAPGPIDGPVAVVVSRFPKLTETFILREIDELERQGQPVVLVPLMRERETLLHDRAWPWLARAVFTPWVSGDVLRSNLSWLNRETGVYLGTLARLVLGSLTSPTMLMKTLALYPKAAYLAEHLSKQGVGHVHAHFATHPATLALIIHRLAGVSFSFTAHAHDIFVRRQLLAWKIRQAQFVRVISEFNRRYLEQRFPGCEQKLRVIHMGLDVDAYDTDSESQGMGAEDQRPLILCVASLQEHKGVDRLIRACAQLADEGRRFQCRVIGAGPERRLLERQVAALGLQAQVDLSGGATEEQVRRAIAGAAIVVQPSLVARDRQMEGIPVALMEAQASGRAVVASRLSGIPELIDHGVNGWLVDPGDTQMLAASLDRLLADSQLRQRLGSAAQRSIRRGFALEDTAAALRAEIRKCSQPAPAGWQALARASLRTGESGGIARASHSPDALTLEVVIAGNRSAHRRYVKQALDRPGASFPARVRTAREATTLRWLAALPDDRMGVPPLIAVDEQKAMVVTGECPGRRMDALLREARSLRTSPALDALTPAVRAAGDWLRRLQALEPPQFPGDDEPTDASAPHCVDQTSTRLAVPDPVASHGDFWPGNVLVDGQARICVVDFEGIGRRSCYYDAAWFLAHLQRYLRRPWHTPLWSALRHAFIDAWSGGDGRLDWDALNKAYRRARERMRAPAAADPDAGGDQRPDARRGIVLDSGASEPR